MEPSITKEEIQALHKAWKRMTQHMPRLRKTFEDNYAFMPLPKFDEFKYPEDYHRRDLGGGFEHFYAVKRQAALLAIEPDLTPPQAKIHRIDDSLKSMVLPTKPARQIPKSSMRVTGVRHNSKAPYPAAWESRIECDFLALLEFDDQVEHYYTQPMTMDWTDSRGVVHTYTPDVFVIWRKDADGTRPAPWLVDMKSASELLRKDLELQEKLSEARKHAQKEGWEFKDITDLQIRSPLLDNVKFLHRPLHEPSSPAAVEMARIIIERLFAQSEPTPKTLLATFPEKEHKAVLYILWMLVARREVLCDLQAPLNEETTILRLAKKYTEEWIMSSFMSMDEAMKLDSKNAKKAKKRNGTRKSKLQSH